MAAGKEIKSRIKTVKNTGKITKAMELISTVKMKKAQESVFELRSFALSALSILRHISQDETVFSKYTIAPIADRELIVVLASQKGLCGGYNVNVFKKLMEYLRDSDGGSYRNNADYITVGKRARDFVLRMGQSLVADFSDTITDPVNVKDSKKLVRFILDAWNSEKYTKISIVYSHYMSAISQVPMMKTLFPFHQNDITEFLSRIAGNESQNIQEVSDFTIEPSPRVVLDYAIPLILDAMMHETILEARASEHASRMVAMKNAKDAANKKASALTLVYNKARQGAITTEITEIVSGVESMKD